MRTNLIMLSAALCMLQACTAEGHETPDQTEEKVFFIEDFTSFERLYPQAKALLKEVDYANHPIRLIGLAVSHPRGEREADSREGSGWRQLELEFDGFMP